MKILFSDVDGTLAHEQHEKYKIPGEDRFVSGDTVELLSEIRKKIPVVIVTGRRITGFERLAVIPYDFGVIEHGCLLLKRGRIDKNYAKEFRKYIGKPWRKLKEGLLWDYEKELQERGYVTDSENRYATFRVSPKVNKNAYELLKIKHPYGIKTVINQGNVDFLPASGGKSHALNHMLIEKHCSWKDAGAFGDDNNDVEMLHSAGSAFTLASASNEVISLVRKKQGYVSEFKYHQGTEDVLRRINGTL